MKIYPKIDFENFNGNISYRQYILYYILSFYDFFKKYNPEYELFYKIPSFEFNIIELNLKQKFNSNIIKNKWIIAHGDPLKKAIFCEENNIKPEDVYILFEERHWVNFLKDINSVSKNKIDNVIIGTKTISKLDGSNYDEISDYVPKNEYIIGGFSEQRILDKRFKNIATKYFILKDIDGSFDRNAILDDYQMFEELVIKNK